MRTSALALAIALAATVIAPHVATADTTHTTAGATADPGVAQDAPRSKRLYMVTDSVGLGAQWALPATFGPEWQITMDGDPGEFTETMEAKYVRPRLSRTPWVFGDYAIVATGYNYPYWDGPRFDRSVDTMVATLLEAGVKHVFWVTLREVKPQYISPGGWRQIQPYYWYFPTVNEHLEAALARHPQLSLIDWAAVADQSGLTYDAIHLNPVGASLYSSISKQAIVDFQTSAAEGAVTRIAIPDAAGVEAVALNLTTVGPRSLGYLTAYDCDRPRPFVSNHNFTRDLTVAHAAIVPVSDSGEVCIYDHVATNLVVDITGRFGADAEITGTESTRLVDTRDRGSMQPALVPLVVGVGSPGVPTVLEVTAVDAVAPGWIRAAPCDSTDTTSTVNVHDASPVPNVAVVVPGADGTVCVTSLVATHLIVDRFLQFGSGSGVSVVRPARVLDTRQAPGTRVAAGGTVVLHGESLGVTDDTTGVMLNLTATDPLGNGFLTAYPCLAGRPTTSNLNFSGGDVVANFVIVEPDANGDVCIYAHSPTHVVVDLLGSVSTGFTGGTPQRLLDTRVANLPANWP